LIDGAALRMKFLMAHIPSDFVRLLFTSGKSRASAAKIGMPLFTGQELNGERRGNLSKKWTLPRCRRAGQVKR
jgi:hypothetical protein